MAEIIRSLKSTKHARATITFDGSTGGGESGTVVPVFTCTGKVLVHYIVAYCTTNLVGASANISMGTTNQVTRFVAATGSETIDADEWWVSATPTIGSIDLPADTCQAILVSENIVINPTTADTTAGVVVVDVEYEAISDDGALA